MTPPNVDPLLVEFAAMLNNIDTPDPNATIRYGAMSDALIWSDETTPQMPTELIWSLRIVFNFRTHLIRGTRIDDTSVWDHYNSIFPHWIGFLRERRTPNPELLAMYRRGESASRWCLRRLEREINADGG